MREHTPQHTTTTTTTTRFPRSECHVLSDHPASHHRDPAGRRVGGSFGGGYGTVQSKQFTGGARLVGTALID